MVYEIPKNERVLKAFGYANEQIPEKIRLEDLRKVCDKNLKDWRIPIQYQYLWYCLNKIKINRKSNKREFNPKVNCYPFYTEINRELSEIIDLAVKKIGSRKEFGKLVDRSKPRVCDWINGKIKIPITALIKACQILNKNIWFILDEKRVYGQNRNGSFIFKNLKRNNILDILVWIKLEGNISLSKGRIEIEQKDVGINALLNLNKNIITKFGVKTHFYKRKRNHRKNWMYVLRINSSPLKQILYLKYGIDFGYKSSYVNLNDEIKVAKTKLEKIKILVSAMETEGCFDFNKVQKYLYPRCNFTSMNKITVENIKSLMYSLGLSPYIQKKDKTCWRTYLHRKKDCSKFFNLILPYMTHQEKIDTILKIKNTLNL